MAIIQPAQLATGSYSLSGSFSGSFQGNGAGLNNIPSSAIVGLSSTQIASGAVTASVSEGTGSFTITSGSSTFMFVSSSGNVGVGTTTPIYKLHNTGTTGLSQVFGTSPSLYVYNGRTSYDSTLKIENQSGDNLYFGGSGLLVTGNTTIGNGTSTLSARLGVKGSGATSATTALLVQNSNTSASLVVNDDGRVAIGQSTPYSFATFTVNGSVYTSTAGSAGAPALYIGSSGAGAGRGVYGFGSGIAVAANNGTSMYFGGSPNLGSSDYPRIGINVTPSAVLDIRSDYTSSNLMNISSSIGTVMFISGSGNVGIGTSTPSRALEIFRSGLVDGSVEGIRISVSHASATAQAALEFNHSTFGRLSRIATDVGSGGSTPSMYFIHNSITAMKIANTGNVQIGTTTDAGFKLTVSGSGASGSVNLDNTLYVSGSRVGIGTTAPLQKLHINGNGVFGPGISGESYIQINPGRFSGNNQIIFNDFDGGIGSRGGFIELGTYYGQIRYGSYNWFYIGDATNAYKFYIAPSTGNVVITNQNTQPTDAGYRLDVNGTARVQNELAVSVQTGNGGVNSIRSYGNDLSIATGWYFRLRIVNDSNAILLGTSYDGAQTYLYSDRRMVLGNTSINPSAILQSDSTTRGFLPPRMTTTQKNAIATPAEGLMVYDTDLKRPCFYNGTAWTTL